MRPVGPKDGHNAYLSPLTGLRSRSTTCPSARALGYTLSRLTALLGNTHVKPAWRISIGSFGKACFLKIANCAGCQTCECSSRVCDVTTTFDACDIWQVHRQRIGEREN